MLPVADMAEVIPAGITAVAIPVADGMDLIGAYYGGGMARTGVITGTAVIRWLAWRLRLVRLRPGVVGISLRLSLLIRITLTPIPTLTPIRTLLTLLSITQIPVPSEPQQSYWYYCQDPQGYYPYVRNCPGGWQQVLPTPPQSGKEGVAP